jgi:hypothetical protein
VFHNGSFLLLTSALAADSLSVDTEDGIGGTFINENLMLSKDALLRRENDEDVLLNLFREVSLLLFPASALSGRVVLSGCGVVDRTTCLISGGCGSSSSSNLDDLGDTWAATGRRGVMGSIEESTEALLGGDRPLLLSPFLRCFDEGEGDRDVEEIHGLRARLRNVSATNRLGVFGRPGLSGVRVLNPGTDPIDNESSDDTVTFGADNFFLIFLDALRNTCLFAECTGPLGFIDISDDDDRPFSEKVRLIPGSGMACCAPGMYVKLAERERPLLRPSLSALLGGRVAIECTGLRTWAGTAGKQSTSAPAENIAGESGSRWRRGAKRSKHYLAIEQMICCRICSTQIL